MPNCKQHHHYREWANFRLLALYLGQSKDTISRNDWEQPDEPRYPSIQPSRVRLVNHYTPIAERK